MRRDTSRRLAASGIATGLAVMRHLGPERAAQFASGSFRLVGRFLASNRIARDKLAAAFPDKSAEEITRILAGVWDNLGRTSAEYASLDRLWDFDLARHGQGRPADGRIVIDEDNTQRLARLIADPAPMLGFSAHLANWEACALAVTAHGRAGAALHTRTDFGALAQMVDARARANPGIVQLTAAPDIGPRLRTLLRNGAHLGVMMDEHARDGIEVQFFGHTCKANPLLARLARMTGAPIHGMRTIRLPENRLRFEVTEAVAPSLAADGRVDVAATTQKIMTIIEGWIREHPDQWPWWLRRRWL
jgi:KDO2-lipid IV(A) lauroyltransferase